MGVILTYTTDAGKQEDKEYEDSVKMIDLSGKNIAYVDLSPLSICLELSKLVLRNNGIQYINLTPLRYCTNLNELDIRNIDITPLLTLSNLQIFNQDSTVKQETILAQDNSFQYM